MQDHKSCLPFKKGRKSTTCIKLLPIFRRLGNYYGRYFSIKVGKCRHVHPAITQISLRIRTILSESFIWALWLVKDSNNLSADSKGSDQTAWNEQAAVLSKPRAHVRSYSMFYWDSLLLYVSTKSNALDSLCMLGQTIRQTTNFKYLFLIFPRK